jgi:glycosyltransferase involved in cell wall biosynthesis
MNRAVIVSFFDYGSSFQKVLYNFFLKHCLKWIGYVNKVYVVDSGFGINESPHYKIEIIKKPKQSHWQNMNEMIRQVSEPLLLLMDSDMIIYNPEIIQIYFSALEECDDDIWTILDSSGGTCLGDKYPIMAENKNRAERRRICPYLCFLRRSILPHGFDFTPRGGENWTDSMGVITEQLLEKGIKIQELQDDRSTISLEDDGKITSCQWLDTPPKLWALQENPNLGYYHIRNFGGGLKILDDKNFGLVPNREARRLLAWVYILALKTKSQELIDNILNTFGNSNDSNDYIKQFEKYHSWLEKI